jgi:acyl-CoA synthetase (AMP-forming)/AMP-acid ligase II
MARRIFMVYTLRDLLLQSGTAFHSRTALVDGERRINYGHLLERVRQRAAWLEAYGIHKGDRVAVYLPRSIDAVVTLFAVWFVGGVAVFVNDLLKTRQVNHILQHSGASLLVTSDRLLGSLNPPGLPDQNIRTLEQGIDSGNESATPAFIGDDLAMIIYTSGSTGLPKGIMLSHQNLLSGAMIISDYLHLTADDILISLLPFSFDYGLNQLLSSVFVGASLVIHQSMFPADICYCLVREQVTGMASVPVLWQQLAHPRSPFTKTRFPKLRYITNTGGRMPENVTRLFRQAHPDVKIYLMYGLTEAFRSAYLPPEQVDIRPGSVGKAIPNVELTVINEQGVPCKPGEPGELIHRGATISLGYWNDPETTAKVFRPNPLSQCSGGRTEIVVYSGDTFKTDEEGFLYYVGRKDAMIKSHGMRISVDEIENCIHASNLVSHVVAFAIEKNEAENEIIAAVVPRDPTAFKEGELLSYCKDEMPEFLRPKAIWTITSLPQTSSGKPDRVAIKDAYSHRK